ncbi:uncharacterized protein LOC125765367 [Anopheles funestus]|uniref:uncharacterized protein LOC125765367 n=1 Tax=Anopheles funestus TaxID=62324 RepID=UPI0020C5CB82|nr:uncharacterized protein LOC125765367 [Anopheles funestus]
MGVAEAGPSKAPTTPSNESSEVEDAILDQTVVENTALESVEEMSRLIAEEIDRHNKEMSLRKQLLELKMKHQKELREMEQSYQQLDISFPVVETKPPVAKVLSVTPEQRLARKSVSTSLAKFSGKVEEWPLFISSFKYTTESCGFSNLENLKRLQDCLTGDALEQVRGSLLTPETVPSVIEDLKNLFGRPQKLLKMMLKKVRETKPPTEDQVKTFIVFGMKVKQLNEHLVACEMTEHLGNPLLVDELVGKLPTSYKREWVQFRKDKPESALCLFNKFVQSVVSELAEVDEYEPELPTRRDRKEFNAQAENKRKPPLSTGRFKKEYTNVHLSKDSTKRIPSCWICNQAGHTLNSCIQFLKMTVAERIAAAEKGKLCKTCLSKFCQGVCPRSLQCEVNGCGKQHHTLVHRTEEHVQLQRANSGGETLRSQVVIYRTIPITLHYGDNSVDVTAFVDEGSSATLIDESVAEQLKADGPNEPLQITWTGNISRFEDRSKKLDLLISSKGSTQRWKLFEPRTVAGLMLPSQTLRLADVVKRYDHLADIPIIGSSQQNPMLVIGLNNIELFAALETRVGNPGEPVAVRSKIGWTIYGVADRVSTPHVVMNLHRITAMTNRELHDAVGSQYKLEQMSVPAFKMPIAGEEKRAKDILERTTRRVGNRFETGLLWREDNRSFPDSYPTAEKRMQQLARRLKRNPALESRVTEMIREYERKGYAHKVTEAELSGFSKDEVWYLPLNVVHNAKKPEKIRLVWDAASTVAGVSLNSMLIKGPDMLVPLPNVVCRFRERAFAFGGDLKEMYHQLRIRDEDKQTQRFLFGSDTEGKPQIYVMDVATFGATCSPCSAQFIKNLNALEFSEQYPDAARAIVEKHYVDDYYDSADTEAEAIKLAKETSNEFTY